MDIVGIWLWLKDCIRFYGLWLTLLIVIASHMTLVVCMPISFLMLCIYSPWYVALPICTFIVRLLLERNVSCPITTIENYLREKLSLNKIGGFVGHYFKKPFKKLSGCLRKYWTEYLGSAKEIT